MSNNYVRVSTEFEGGGKHEKHGFFTIFKTFDNSMLLVISVTNFAAGFRRLLELGLYNIFR